MIKLKDKKGLDSSGAFIAGIIMLLIFGGLIPYLLSPFVPSDFSSDYSGYLSIPKQIIGWIPTRAGAFLSNQLNGFSLIPPIIGIPIVVLTISFLLLGVAGGLKSILSSFGGVLGGLLGA